MTDILEIHVNHANSCFIVLEMNGQHIETEIKIFRILCSFFFFFNSGSGKTLISCNSYFNKEMIPSS